MLRLEGVFKRRSQGDSVFELVVPRLRVAAGQLVGVVGESGCGKSTLLDMLALVMAPTHAQRFELDLGAEGGRHDLAALWVCDAEAALAALRRDHLGYVLQTGGLLPFLSVRDNIALPARIKGNLTGRDHIAGLARRVGLEGCLERLPEALSIGQRQRAAILRAIVHGPQLVLADEPTASVDKTRARAIFDDMQSLAQEDGAAVVVVTHDVELVSDRCDAMYTFETTPLSAQHTRSVCRPLRSGPER